MIRVIIQVSHSAMADTFTSWQDVLTIDKTIFDGAVCRCLKIFAVDLEPI